MKPILTLIILNLLHLTAIAQPIFHISSPYKENMDKNFPNLYFREVDNDSVQFLDYSGNWDFDDDGKKDSLIFSGNGGAHLYYHLIIKLSTESQIRDYPWLTIDFPALGSVTELKPSSKGSSPFPQFAVGDIDSDNRNDIYIKLDASTYLLNSKQLKSLGITTHRMILKYINGKMVIRNYK